MDNNNFLAKKFHGRIKIKNAWAYYQFHKKGRIQKLMHQMKYHNMPEIGEFVGLKVGKTLKAHALDTGLDLIIPVPLHKNKLRKRGYNQSEHFAIGISKALNLTVHTDALVRTVDTVTQTNKSRMQRLHNVQEIFKVVRSDKIMNKHLLLVDDVVTTGATIESCAYALFNSGVASISIAAMAAAK